MDEKYVITAYGIVEEHEAKDDFIREISTKEELEELIERMPYINDSGTKQENQRRIVSNGSEGVFRCRVGKDY